MKKEKKSFAKQAAEGLILATLGLTGIGNPIAPQAHAQEIKVIEAQAPAKQKAPQSQNTAQTQIVKQNFNPNSNMNLRPAKAWKVLNRFKRQKQFKKYCRKK
jgi:hypothetical protein